MFDDGTELDLAWNETYRLTSATSVSSVVNYSYDVLGRRTSRFVVPPSGGSASTESYVYDGNQVVADLDANGNLIRTYTWGPGIDNLLAITVYGRDGSPQPSGTNTYYALKDHQNSVLALADESGAIAESYEYDAWGNVTMFDANGAEITNQQSAIGNRYLWQGREYDAETGLYYFRARWYNPETGRWLSKDPIGISGGLNQYVFCGNNPVNAVDPDGTFAIVDDGLGALALAALITAADVIPMSYWEEHPIPNFDTERIREIKEFYDRLTDRSGLPPNANKILNAIVAAGIIAGIADEFMKSIGGWPSSAGKKAE